MALWRALISQTEVKATVPAYHKELELGKNYFGKYDPIRKTPASQQRNWLATPGCG